MLSTVSTLSLWREGARTEGTWVEPFLECVFIGAGIAMFPKVQLLNPKLEGPFGGLFTDGALLGAFVSPNEKGWNREFGDKTEPGSLSSPLDDGRGGKREPAADAGGRSDLALDFADCGDKGLSTISGDSESGFSVAGFDGLGALTGDAGGG